jgi:tryptophan halogenase
VYSRIDAARREFETLRTVATHAVNDLPDHRALVEEICARVPSRHAAAHSEC